MDLHLSTAPSRGHERILEPMHPSITTYKLEMIPLVAPATGTAATNAATTAFSDISALLVVL